MVRFTMKHLIDIKDLSQETIKAIFLQASTLISPSKELAGKSVANLFFENSTRTLISFELAAKKLGADVINVNIDKSSTKKGETLRDTIQTLQAMGIDAFVVRHSDNKTCQTIKKWLNPKTKLINAGDGNNQHPTQALLDTYTILQHKQDITNIKISIIGDIKHSRVANSLIDCLNILGNNSIHVYAPEQLLPTRPNKLIICKDFQQAASDADVIVMLRIQKERIAKHAIPDLDNYHHNFGLTNDKLKLAKIDCIVMHPGPVNRGVEITSSIADGNQSVILEQVKNGVLVRQAVLAYMFK